MHPNHQALLDHVENVKNGGTINDLLSILSLVDLDELCEFTTKKINNSDESTAKSMYYKGLSISDVLPINVIQNILSFDDMDSNTFNVSKLFKQITQQNIKNHIKNKIDKMNENYKWNNINTITATDNIRDKCVEFKDGDKIMINDGVYYLDLNQFDLNNNLYIEGIGNNVNIIFKYITPDDLVHELDIGHNIIDKTVHLKNINLHFPTEVPFFRIEQNSTFIMDNCTIFDFLNLNIRVCDGGILIGRNCKINGSYGISVYDAGNVYLSGCILNGSVAREEHGMIELYDDKEVPSKLVLIENIFSNCNKEIVNGQKYRQRMQRNAVPIYNWDRKTDLDTYILRGNERRGSVETIKANPNTILFTRVTKE